MDFIGGILDKVNRAVQVLLVIILVAMMVVVFMQVFFRYVVGNSIPWSEELSRFMLIWISFLGTTVATKKAMHINVDNLVAVIPPKIRRFVALAANLAVLYFAYLMITAGSSLMMVAMREDSSAMEIPMGWVYLAIPLSGTLIFLYVLYQSIELFRSNGMSANSEGGGQ